MEQQHKSKLKSIILELRHLLEGYYDGHGEWNPGDLEKKLVSLGVRRKGSSVEVGGLDERDAKARDIAIAYIKNIVESGGNQENAVIEFVRETAYSWANKLIALRCMESRAIIDEVILQKESYGGRSLKHHRLIQTQPELASTPDSGLLQTIFNEFEKRSNELPSLFDINSVNIALVPSVGALNKMIELLSAPDEIFMAPDALGWAYQYWNTEEKDRVFERVKNEKIKIEKLDIIPATQLYTEPYMVKFLVQNSLGATWYQMNPETNLIGNWEYFVKDADRAPMDKKSIKEITFLDPCVGSGHFLLEAFDLYYDMYLEEGFTDPAEICSMIFEHNLYGIDIDGRAVQISAASLFMKAKEIVEDFKPKQINLVATNIHLSREKDHLAEYLEKYPDDKPLENALITIFESLKHADELGSLLQIEEPVEKELRILKEKDDVEKAYIDDTLEMFKVTRMQGHLPLDVEGYDDWKKSVIKRLKEHFTKETQGENPEQKLFGLAISKGISLFDFLSRKYDVVATNPPYLSLNNNSTLGQFLHKYYPEGKDDSFAAFIIRCLKLACENNRVAMVTQHSWMFLSSYSKLRVSKEDTKSSNFKGVIREVTIETIAHLGTGAFSEISGEVVNVACFVMNNTKPTNNSRISALRLVGIRDIGEKAKYLKNQNIIHKKLQSDFLKIKNSPLIYWFTNNLMEVLKRDDYLHNISIVGEGLSTANNARFIRFFFESLINTNRWFELAKGGSYKKWSGLRINLVDWYLDGIRVKNYIAEKYPYLNGNYSFKIKNEESYFKKSLTYSTMARGAMGVRFVDGSIYDNSGSFISLKKNNDILWLAGILNSRISSFILNSLTQSMSLKYKYVQNFILPKKNDTVLNTISSLTKICLIISQTSDSLNLLERDFSIENNINFLQIIKLDSIKLLIELIIDNYTNTIYELDEISKDLLFQEKGLPSGSHKLLVQYDSEPTIREKLIDIPQEVLDYLEKHERLELSCEELENTKQKLRIYFEAGFGGKISEADEELISDMNDNEDDEEIARVRIPIPAETFLEELSQKMEIHPISIYWLLKEGIEKKGWRSIPEEKKYTLDRYTVYILRLLGHRWPLQIEANEPVPDWADEDGIIPITKGTDERMLLDRIKDRLAEDFGENNIIKEENYFEEVVGSDLDKWLKKEFFKHHSSQFKKRPIAWHMTSNKRTRRNAKPAFEAYCYYQKIDSDFIPKVRTQYSRLLLQRYNLEQNRLENYSETNSEQKTRIIQLQEMISELEDFDNKLKDLINRGFDSPDLKNIAVDDAEQVIAKAWRAKFAELFNKTEETKEIANDTFKGIKYVVDQQFQDIVDASYDDFKESISDFIDEVFQNMSKELELSRPRKKGKVDKFETEDALRKWFTDKKDIFAEESRKLIKEIIDGKIEIWFKEDLKQYKKKMEKDSAKILHLKLRKAVKKFFDELLKILILDEAVLSSLDSWGMDLEIYDDFCRVKPDKDKPYTFEEFVSQEMHYHPDINDGVRVNIAPLQKLGLLQVNVLQPKDVKKAIADRAEWRSDERRWCREGKLPKPGWWE
jgi:hypothetical protein